MNIIQTLLGLPMVLNNIVKALKVCQGSRFFDRPAFLHKNFPVCNLQCASVRYTQSTFHKTDKVATN